MYELVTRLRRRGLSLGVDDCETLRQALAAGFGLSSTGDLTELCVVLWAKSVGEREIVRAAFANVDVPVWEASAITGEVTPTGSTGGDLLSDAALLADAPEDLRPVDEQPADGQVPPAAQHVSGLTTQPPATGSFDRSLVTVPQYPLSEREIAQVWRRLRRPVRTGPPVELDVAATLDRYARTGIAGAPVLIPARRNTARLLMLVDRQGSMTPFHNFVDHVVDAIRSAGRLELITVRYFRNVPGRSRDQALLAELPDPFSPALDPVLARVAPLPAGRLYRDPDLTEPQPFAAAVEQLVPGTAVTIISDGGAARGGFDTGRLLDTTAMLKALRVAGCTVAWLNPVPAARWAGTTAGQIARHIAMYPLTREGMYQAVDVLRGHPARTEQPL
ncbi:VWA domain-containing protein [Micromonospora sp. CA-240977]|uniref:VWA domain-containing protein n=1 Tax=Micromonospora sp. CA-240977 TaxID=3239957 RepID=UPI003D9203A0